MLSRSHNAHARLACTRGNRGSGKNEADDRDIASRCGTFAIADDMPTLDMAKFMRDDALNFVGGSGCVDQAGMEVNGLATGDKRVDRFVVNQNDLDIGGVKPCAADQRLRYFFEKRFGLCIAQD